MDFPIKSIFPLKKVFLFFGLALFISIGIYLSFFLTGKSASFFYASGPEKPVDVDSLSYVPGFGKHPWSTHQQLEAFPLPQFSRGHSLNANFLWMDPSYFGGNGQEGINLMTAVNNSVFIQEQLAKYWNYSVMVNNNTKIFNKYKDPSSFIYAWVQLANKHPEWPAAAITFWGQVRPRHLNDSACNGDRGYIGRTNMHDSLYLYYEPGANHKTKRINPAVHPSNFRCDGLTQQKYIQELLAALKRPLNFINENGEVFHLISDAKLEQDERVQRDRKKFEGLSTYQYQSKKRLILEQDYRNAFLHDARLSGTHYSVYAVDGYDKYRHDYAILREIQTPLRRMRYSTPDFYPRWPNNWRRMQGPWHGLEWIEVCRDKETALGDHLFSPFVAAGWDKDETINIPPGQWLGLLKLLNVFGAEFFYTGYFNEKMPPNDPRNYCWQSVMPSFAQAVFSCCPESFLEGVTLKEGQWLLKSSREDVAALVRKNKNKEQYLLSVTLQHKANDIKNPNTTDAIIYWRGLEIHLAARVQGSVYFIDLSNPSNPIVVMLDQWHQWEHPARWSKEHWMEAGLMAENTAVRSFFSRKNAQWDLRNLISFVALKEGASYEFSWQQRQQEKADTLVLLVNETVGPVEVELFNHNQSLGRIYIKKGLNFIRLSETAFKHGEMKLSLRVIKGSMALQRWKIKSRSL